MVSTIASPAPASSARPSKTVKFVSLAIATVFGIGYVPVAPGTFGSIAGLLLWMVLPASTVVQAAAIVALLVVGSLAGNVAEHHFGRTDPRQVIIDEVMGMLITLFLNPVASKGAFVGFLFFRCLLFSSSPVFCLFRGSRGRQRSLFCRSSNTFFLLPT